MTLIKHLIYVLVLGLVVLIFLGVPCLMSEIASREQSHGGVAMARADETGLAGQASLRYIFEKMKQMITARKSGVFGETASYMLTAAGNGTGGADATVSVGPSDSSGGPGFPISEDVLDSVILIKGSTGAGTGFIAKDKDTTYIYSNIHVLMGNSHIKFTDRQGKSYSPKGMEFALDRDLVRLTIAETPASPLTITEPKGMNIPVAVCGNAEGEGIVRVINGKMVGYGPQKIETDASFVKGHSGSPILTAEGGIVGIATYVRQANVDWVNTNTPFTVVRRFGYRIDNVPRWVKLSPKVFVTEAGKIQERLENLMNISDILDVWAVDPYWQELPRLDTVSRDIQAWVEDHNAWVKNNKGRLRTAKVSRSNADSISREFHTKLRKDVEQLKSELRRSLKYPKQQWHLDFFKEQWDDLTMLEQTLIKAVDYIYTVHTSYDPVRVN